MSVSGAKDLASLGYGLSKGFINPGALFGLVSLFGGSEPEPTGAFYLPQFRDYTTDRVKHVDDGIWEFNDPSIKRNFRFRQDKRDRYHMQDPETGEWTPGSDPGGAKRLPIEWNLGSEEARVRLGGGADDEWSTLAFSGMPGAKGKKLLPWQYSAMRSGPYYKPILPKDNPDSHYLSPNYKDPNIPKTYKGGQVGSQVDSGGRRYYMPKSGVWQPLEGKAAREDLASLLAESEALQPVQRPQSKPMPRMENKAQKAFPFYGLTNLFAEK